MIELPCTSIKRPSLRRQKLVLWLAFLVISVVSGLAFYSTQRLIAASERVERTQNMLIETHRFISEIRAVESSSRAYYVTGDDRYLESRADNFASSNETAARIRALPIGGELRRRLDRRGPGGMTGYQLADEVRLERPDVRVLFTSGYTELAAASGQAARKEPLLSKPYRKQDLGRAVRLALDAPASVEPAG